MSTSISVLKVRSTGRVAMCLQEEQRIWPGGEMEKSEDVLSGLGWRYDKTGR